MYCVRKVVEDVYWIGGSDNRLTLFENIHPLPRGISYNSYVLLDDKTVLFDTVDWAVCHQFLENLKAVLKGRTLDYMVLNHVEPDHAACIKEIILRYPEVRILCTKKAAVFLKQFGFDINEKIEVVKEGDTKSFGKHKVMFVTAPMVHWPEVMVTYDTTNNVLFSADAFGTFGALGGRLFNDEVDFDRNWLDDSRRYYANIIGKYGFNVQLLLKKLDKLNVKVICPLHGPVWRSNLEYYFEKYDRWSRYEPEKKGVMIVYASMYGDTESAAHNLAIRLVEGGMKNVVMYDVSKTHVSYLISETFKYSHIVLASVTYNMKIYPPMLDYLEHMKALNLQKRTFALIENGSWAPQSGKLMREFLGEMKDMTVLDKDISLRSSMKEEDNSSMKELAGSIIQSAK
jgi:flavorubredoxin